jgi:hypothetical protein
VYVAEMVDRKMHRILMRKPLRKQPVHTEEGGRIIRWVMRMVVGGWIGLWIVSSYGV